MEFGCIWKLTISISNCRIIVFIEPIALYMTKDLHKNKDNEHGQ